jgi:hypothetical protein
VNTTSVPVLATVMIKRGRLQTERFNRSLLNLAVQGLRTHCSDAATAMPRPITCGSQSPSLSAAQLSSSAKAARCCASAVRPLSLA